MSRNLFLFEAGRDGKVVMTAEDPPSLPSAESLGLFEGRMAASGPVDRGQPDGDLWGELTPDAALPEGYMALSRRDLPPILGYYGFVRAGLAFQLMNWKRSNRFCGRCGVPTRESESERAMKCPGCGHLVFPTLSPAVIVAVEKEGRLLMGSNANFPAGRYSVLAGFVEPGETLEEAVAREIYEESGVCVKNVRYFGSQPWPFPNSLMLGFRAEWESGEPTPDGEELTDVRWFSPDALPDIPSSVSISRQLIDDWLKRSASR